MVETSKKLIIGSAVVAGLVALACVFDLALGFPFGGYDTTSDILFLVGSLLVLFMGYDAWKDLR